MATKPTAALQRIRDANGNAYDEVTNPGGLAQGGHRQNFVPDLQATADVSEWTADLAEEAETARNEAVSAASTTAASLAATFAEQRQDAIDARVASEQAAGASQALRNQTEELRDQAEGFRDQAQQAAGSVDIDQINQAIAGKADAAATTTALTGKVDVDAQTIGAKVTATQNARLIFKDIGNNIRALFSLDRLTNAWSVITRHPTNGDINKLELSGETPGDLRLNGKQVPVITVSTGEPSGGSNGELWAQVE